MVNEKIVDNRPYVILEHSTPIQLMESVAKYLEWGYKLHGNMFIDNSYYTQVVYKETK